jgi:hypothetical protein
MMQEAGALLRDGVSSALYPIREAEDTPFFGDRRKRPSPISTSKPDVGSEFIATHLIKRICGQNSGVAYDHPSISTLKRFRIRRIILLDDIIGSGKRAVDFIKWLLGDSSIKSAISCSDYQVVIVTYAATSTGISKIMSDVKISRRRRTTDVIKVVSVQKIDEEAAVSWGSRINEFTTLAKRYANIHNIRFPLGYRDCFSNLVFQHGCPNNCPGLLYSASSSWIPLFFGRTIPVPMHWRFQSATITNGSRVAEDIMMALLTMRGSRRTISTIALYTGHPLPAILLAVQLLKEKGYLRPNHDQSRYYLTPQARLEAGGIAKRRRHEHTHQPGELKYPYWVVQG